MASRSLKLWRKFWRGEKPLRETNIDLPSYPQSTLEDEKLEARDTLSPLPYTCESAERPRRTTVYKSPAESPYAFLGEFDTVFIVDDSSSMLGQRWKEAEEAIAPIVPICTMFDRGGIDIYFLNHRRESSALGVYTNLTTAAEVERIFSSVRPRGMTPFGKRLRQILVPYLNRVEKMAAGATVDGFVLDRTLFIKPLNIIAITDGAFTDDAESVLIDTAKRLDACRASPWQVMVQFFQVGTDEGAAQYLRELNDNLARRARDRSLRGFVETVPWTEGDQALNGQGIMKCVLRAVHKKYDNQDVTSSGFC